MGYLLGLEGLALPVTVAEGYDIWSPRYDTEENDLLGLEQPVVWGLIDQLPAGTALDAACGTGGSRRSTRPGRRRRAVTSPIIRRTSGRCAPGARPPSGRRTAAAR